MVQELESSALEILRGLDRSDGSALAKLAEVEDWRRIAATELERRATAFIQSLDEATVRAIAEGKIDLARLCRTVREEASPRTSRPSSFTR